MILRSCLWIHPDRRSTRGFLVGRAILRLVGHLAGRGDGVCCLSGRVWLLEGVPHTAHRLEHRDVADVLLPRDAAVAGRADDCAHQTRPPAERRQWPFTPDGAAAFRNQRRSATFPRHAHKLHREQPVPERRDLHPGRHPASAVRGHGIRHHSAASETAARVSAHFHWEHGRCSDHSSRGIPPVLTFQSLSFAPAWTRLIFLNCLPNSTD